MLITASVVVIGFGLLCLFDREFAWRLIELDARNFWGKTLSRSNNWQRDFTWQAICIILLGIIGLVVGMQTL